jgi:hypothetical protein
LNLHTIKKHILDRPLRRLYFDAIRMAGGQSNVAQKDTYVFTLSTGRVGTETLAALLELTPFFFTHHEPAPILYRLSKTAYENEENSSAHRILVDAFLTAREELFNHASACGRGYIETSPQVTFLAPVILEALPNARFIHLIRNPRDVIRSGMRRKWYDGHPYDATRITPKPQSPAFEKWDRYTPFQKNVWLWTETNLWIGRFLEQVSEGQKLFMRSEELFTYNHNLLARLFEFVGAPVPSQGRLLKVLNQKLNAQKSGNFPAAHEWNQDAKDQFREIGSEALKKFGYQD